MSWAFYLSLITFFTILFTVFYAIACSVLLGIRDNYLRYYQKTELQWTSPRPEKRNRAGQWKLLAVLSLVTAWIVVHFVIQP